MSVARDNPDMLDPYFARMVSAAKELDASSAHLDAVAARLLALIDAIGNNQNGTAELLATVRDRLRDRTTTTNGVAAD